MPCQSCSTPDLSQPTSSRRETEAREVATHLVYLLGALKRDIPPVIASAAASSIGIPISGSKDALDRYVALLCSTLKGLSPKQADRVVYDGRVPAARRLADWWEAHQEQDRRREAAERERARRHALREKALSKLTPEERKALGVRDDSAD